jgi:hypothetical protein
MILLLDQRTRLVGTGTGNATVTEPASAAQNDIFIGL